MHFAKPHIVLYQEISVKNTIGVVGDKKVLLLLSGGIDSAVCLSMLQRQGLEVTTLSFRQESRLNNMPEVLCARAIASRFGTRHIEVDLTSVDELIKHAPNVRLSLGGQINNCPGITTLGAPMSVSIMLSMAFMHACTAGIEKIAWALHADDLQNEFHHRKVLRLIALHQDLAELQAQTRPVVILPLAVYTKEQIVGMALEYGIKVAETFSCSDPLDGQACGKCDQCRAREAAIFPSENRQSA
ncbi:MAG: 7-cyano-7-deazaguanine synthase [Candidatus Roizmanbacteria bacterium]|nr:7-cyano-7-deazaguanine synthase [Candidatus Roizmanbacteria bacterium]